MMVENNITNYIFYHDGVDKNSIFKSENDNIELINLDECIIPNELLVSELTEHQNRAIYSEYLGMLSIAPKSEMVGLFTYSIPYKYSYENAKHLKYPLTKHCGKWMLPPIKFDYLENKSFEADKIYGAYFRSYLFNDDPANEIIREIDSIDELRVPSVGANDDKGPFNGTVVVNHKTFVNFQIWLKRIIVFLLNRYGYTCGLQYDDNNQEIKKANIEKFYENENTSEFDAKFRRGIGHVLERCFAYYFGKISCDSTRVDLKKKLNDKTKLYIFSSPSHDEMKNNYFLPSIQDNFEIVEETHSQICKTGEYHTEGWGGVVNQKVDLIIRAIHENWGGWFIHSDVDVQMFAPIEGKLKKEIKDFDIVFQTDCPYPRPVACAGFFASKANESTLLLWESVKKLANNNNIDDQCALNIILHRKEHEVYTQKKLRWRFLPTEFFSPGSIPANFLKINPELNKDSNHLMDKEIIFDHSWRWEINEKRDSSDYMHPSMYEFQIPHGILIHHANYTEGIVNKLQQLRYVKNKVRGD